MYGRLKTDMTIVLSFPPANNMSDNRINVLLHCWFIGHILWNKKSMRGPKKMYGGAPYLETKYNVLAVDRSKSPLQRGVLLL